MNSLLPLRCSCRITGIRIIPASHAQRTTLFTTIKNITTGEWEVQVDRTDRIDRGSPEIARTSPTLTAASPFRVNRKAAHKECGATRLECSRTIPENPQDDPDPPRMRVVRQSVVPAEAY